MPRIRVEIVGDPSSAVKAFKTTERQAEHLGRELRRADRDMSRFGRGVVAGTGVLGGLGRSIGFASSAFLGGAGLVYAFRKVTAEARNAQVVQVRVAQAVRNSGNEWQKHKRYINDVIQAQSRLAAFDDEVLLDTFGHLVTRTRDVNRALDLNALAANVARGRNMELEASSRLVLKASMGNVGALRRLGINLDKNATATQILAALQQRYAGQAVKFGKTSEGAQARWNKTLEDSEEIIGRTLLPSIDNLLRKGTEWLDHQNRSGQLQKTVNQNFKAAEEILTGVADGLKIIKTLAEPVVDAVGGIGNAVKTLTVLWVAMKAKALLGFTMTASASSVMRTKIVADAAAMGTALDIATRPRVIPITVVGGGGGVKGIGAYGTGKLPRAPNRAPAPAPKAGFLGRIAQYAGPIAAGLAATYAAAPTLTVGTILSVLISAGGGTKRENRASKYPRVYKAVARAAAGTADSGELQIIQQTLGQYSLENAPDKNMRMAETQLRRLQRAKRQYRSGNAMPGPAAGPPPKGGDGAGGAGGGGAAGGLRTRAAITTDILRARATGNEALEVRFLREEKAKIKAQIRSLERRGELTDKERQQLDALYGDLAGTNAALSTIAQANAKDVKKSNDKAADAQKKAAEAARDAAEKMQQAWQNARTQAGQAFSDLFTGPVLGGGFGDFIRQYGMQGATIDPRLILQDIRQQNAQTAGLIRNLQTLAKRGMPVGVMNQLREMGPEGAGFIASLANAPKAVFDAVVAALGVRQQQLEKATIFIQARNVTVKSGAAADVQGDKPPVPHGVATGGVIPGSGIGDSVPAMLTPGELVLNRMQQGGLARAMGMAGASPQGLFGAINRMGGGGGFGGGGLDGRPWWERVGPKRWSPHGARGTPIAPLRRDIGPWLSQFYGRGMSPAFGRGAAGWWGENFSKVAQGFQFGGIVKRFTDWTKSNTREVDVLRNVGEFLGRPAKTRGGRYFSKQAEMFGETIVPTVEGTKMMGELLRDLGLGYHPLAAWSEGGGEARGRANTVGGQMVRAMIQALRHPIANAGLLAGMMVPLPGPSKLTGPTRALERFKMKIIKAGAKFPGPDAEVPMQPGNMRLVRETVSSRGLPRQFNRAAAESTAHRVLAEIKASGRLPKDVLPIGVRTVDDLIALQHDLFNSARKGKVAKKWYEKSGAAILDYAGGDLARAHKLAKLAAVYSPQVTVEESLRVAARAWEQWHREGKIGPMGIPGDTRSAVVDGKRVKVPSLKQREDAMRIMRGEDFDLGGRKVQNFYTDLVRGFDPQWIRNRTRRGKLTNRAMTADVWMMKAFGFAPKLNSKGKWKTPGPTDLQYDFIEWITKGVADQLGWQPHQAQAAIWTTTKSRFEGRPPSNAAFNFRDYFNRQSTQINYEAAWGDLGQRILRELGPDAALRYANEKFALLRPGGNSEVLARLGLLGQPGGAQRGVYGLDINPGTHDLVLAPRFPERMQRFRMMPSFEKRIREAAAITGFVLRQDGVGTMTQFPSKTAAGTINANVKAGENAYYLARKLDDAELVEVNQKLGERMIMAPRGDGWILKPFSNRVNMERLGARLRSKLGGYQLEPATAPSGMVWSDEYMRLIERADKHSPGIKAWALQIRKQADEIDSRYRARLMGPPAPVGRAGGGMIPGFGSGDTVPAMLTPGEMVLNRRQQAGVSRALGLGRRTGSSLFGEIQRFQSGGVLSMGRARSAQSFLPGSSSAAAQPATFQQVNTITVPPEFADTKWAIERGLKSATWRLAKGI